MIGCVVYRNRQSGNTAMGPSILLVGIGFLLGVQVVPGPQGEGLQGSLIGAGSQELVTLAQDFRRIV
jgi:hypothetical protein